MEERIEYSRPIESFCLNLACIGYPSHALAGAQCQRERRDRSGQVVLLEP